MNRNIEIVKAVRSQLPLFIGLWGPSGCGKTFSALKIATGIQKVTPGPIVFIDTENGRGKHYADVFNYEYVRFDPPFNSLDYLDIIEQVEGHNPSVIIVDSFSHEHSGENGYLQTQGKKAEELAAKWHSTPDKTTMPAWAFVSSQRKKLLLHITRMGTHFITCFRAKEKSVPMKNSKGKMGIENIGYMPESGKEFVFEMTLSALLPPGSDGRAYFQTGNKGEDMMTKLPLQFREIFQDNGVQLNEDIGERLATWARGDSKPAQQTAMVQPAAKSPGGISLQVVDDEPEHIIAINTLKDYLDNNLVPQGSVENTEHMVGWLERNGMDSRNHKNWTAIMEHIRYLETTIADPDRVDHGLTG